MGIGKHFAKGSPKPQLPDDGVLRLYSMRFCPFAHRIHLVLDAKKIPYHSIFINLTEKPEWLTEYSPLGKVPALQIVTAEGKPSLIESLIIAEYLDEAYPEHKLLPVDPLKKTQEKILIELFNTVVGPMHRMLGNVEVTPAVLATMFTGLDIYEKELRSRGTAFFGGDKPGMLDYMIWPWCERFSAMKIVLNSKYEVDKQRFEKLLQWSSLMLKDEAVKCFYLDGETHSKYIKSRLTGTPDYDMLL